MSTLRAQVLLVKQYDLELSPSFMLSCGRSNEVFLGEVVDEVSELNIHGKLGILSFAIQCQ